MRKFTPIIDSREKKPFEFSPDWCNKPIITKLDTGDYSISGLTDLVAIERKMSTSEIAINMAESRFKNVLERLKSYKYKAIVCEFSYSDVLRFPIGSGIPKYIKTRVTNNWMNAWLANIVLNYQIPVLYADNQINANNLCFRLMKSAWELEQS